MSVIGTTLAFGKYQVDTVDVLCMMRLVLAVVGGGCALGNGFDDGEKMSIDGSEGNGWIQLTQVTLLVVLASC